MLDIIQLKYKIIEQLSKLPDFRRISNNQFRMRCRYCGDSQTDLSASHMYIKCTFDDESPILYNCFKGNCNAHGKVDSNFLKLVEVEIPEMSLMDNRLFKKIPTIKDTNVDILTGSPDMDSKQVNYIEYRLGSGLTIEDYDKFKIVWNMDEMRNYINNKRIKHILPNNNDSISFLSDDKSVLLTRFFHNHNIGWKKIKLFNNENRSFYTIKGLIDLFTTDNITVNIAEGVFDVLSIYKNFSEGISVYVACLGSDYEAGINYIIAKGFIGSNINVNIYVDADINDKILKHNIKEYKWLFNSISIIKNINSKDVGVPISDIQLKKYEI